MTKKRFTECDDGTYCLVDNGKGLEYDEVISLLNAFYEENEQLREALKNSYINEICENCKYGNYSSHEVPFCGWEHDFECTKKHFGNDHWKCDGLTECDDFELKLKGDDEG